MDKKKYKKRITSLLLLLAGNLLVFLTIWLLDRYDRIYIDQVLFQMKSSSEGVQGNLALNATVRIGLFGIATTAVEYWIYKKLFRRGESVNFVRKHTIMFSALSLVVAVIIFITQLDVVAYVGLVSTNSSFIEENYVSPYEVNLEFPQEKRNLIYIFLESMENTFADTSVGEPIFENCIPELTKLAEENVNFSHTKELGGAYSYLGTTWTAAAMATQTSGVPIKVIVRADEDTYGAEDDFLPGVVSIGEVLEKHGYNQTLLVGSDAEFHGRQPYFVQHGNYNIVDIDSLKAEGKLPEDYHEWWGFEDQKLFAFAKEEVSKLASLEEPFNFTMLTCDTHFPDGYLCELCQEAYEDQYSNVLACSSRQVYEFVEWIKAQPFYENTTIVISGDHLTMDNDFLEEIDQEYERTIYNCIINAPVEPVNEKNRKFGTMDMFPTTLAAMGVEIEGDCLGLGTNLFSEKATLTEVYGFDLLNEEMQKRSEFYNEEILDMEEEE